MHDSRPASGRIVFDAKHMHLPSLPYPPSNHTSFVWWRVIASPTRRWDRWEWSKKTTKIHLQLNSAKQHQRGKLNITVEEEEEGKNIQTGANTENHRKRKTCSTSHPKLFARAKELSAFACVRFVFVYIFPFARTGFVFLFFAFSTLLLLFLFFVCFCARGPRIFTGLRQRRPSVAKFLETLRNVSKFSFLRYFVPDECFPSHLTRHPPECRSECAQNQNNLWLLFLL